MNDSFGGFSPVFVFAAYTAVWLVVFGYVFYLARRQSDTRAELDQLREEIKRRS